MKKYIILLLASIAVTINACNKENLEIIETKDCSSISSDEAQSSFAKILSQAVSDNLHLRSFIKETALKEFDYDYDVFYPFVKDYEVEPGKTFRDILLKYCTESELSVIEQSIPKLNILVPDWSWIGCFSINDWDVTDSIVAVSYVSEKDYVEVFEKGESLGNLPSGSFPDFPVLIIKSNERMSYTPSTKGTNGGYSFIDSAFENTQTKVQHSNYDITVDGTPDISNFVAEGDINYKVKEAYNYFPQGPTSIYQRDYLYYNMTAPNQTMPRYSNVREKIYKFKFTKFNDTYFRDDETDFKVSEIYKPWEYAKNGAFKTTDQLRSHFYAEGSLDLQFLINIPSHGCNYSTTKVIPVEFSDVFAIDKVNLDFRHKTWFCRDRFIYTLDASAIKPKWCTVNLELPDWDISQSSCTITIQVMEFDETGSSEIEINSKTTISTNFKVDASGEFGFGQNKTLKVGLGSGVTISNENSTKEKYTRTQGGIDNLGTAELEYELPVLERKITKNKKTGYEVKTISTGTVDLMIIPYSY